MKPATAFALGAGLGVVIGTMLQNVQHAQLEAEAASGEPVNLWDVLSPSWLKRWGRDADSGANEERAFRRLAEMSNET